MRKTRQTFSEFFNEAYPGRWSGLAAAMRAPSKLVARFNQFAGVEPERSLVAGLEIFEAVPGCYLMGDADPHLLEDFGPTMNGVRAFYYLDAASVIAARALGVEAGHRVLDLCAAPGGKFLILAEALRQHGLIVANEKSVDRRIRLQNVVRDYIPAELQSRVQITGVDGLTWGQREPNTYDRVLVDAPCSSERHLMEDDTQVARWTMARTTRMSYQQYTLLASAFDAAKPGGGRVLYCTCSISPLENDPIVAKLLLRKGAAARVIRPAVPPPFGEATEHGHLILPDRCDGWGPLYFSLIEKV